MSDLFYLQDSRSNVGSRAMFWRAGGGYTSNLDEAEEFTREGAVRQYECRETDLPWPVAYVRGLAQVGVDHQDIDLPREQALAAAPADDCIYVTYPRVWDGNCLIWFGRNAGIRSNLAHALTWSLAHAEGFTARGYLPWPKSYIDQVARPVAVASTLDHKQALRSVGLKLPKLKRQPTRRRRDILNCSGCGRFLTELQRFDDCPNCGARNAP